MNALISYFLGLAAAAAVLLALSMFFFRQLKQTPEEALAYAVVSIILSVFFFGLVGNAKIAFYLILAVACLGLALGLTNRRLTRRGLIQEQSSPGFKRFFSPGILLYLTVIAVAAAAFYGTCYQNWDEFVQWGKALRFMGETNALPVGQAYDGLGYMQSCTTYFHYFTGVFTGFDEAASYVSNVMLYAAVLPLCFSGAQKRDAGRVFAFGLFAFLMSYALYDLPFYNLYTDQALAFFTGALICYAMRSLGPGSGLSGWILAALLLVCIGMAKPQAGLLFAAISAIAILFMLPAGKKGAPKKKLSKKQRIIVACAACLAILSPFLISKLWSSLVTQGSLALNFVRISQELSDRSGMANLFYTLYRGLFEPLAGMEFMTYVNLFAVTAALMFLSSALLPKGSERTRYLRTGSLYLVGFIAYFVVVYFTYLFILPASDRVSGTSLNRYLSIYLMAGVLPMTAPLFQNAGPFPTDCGLSREPVPGASLRRGLTSVLCLCLLLFPATHLESAVLYDVTSLLRWDDPYYRLYMDVRAEAERVTELTGDARIYYINQTSDSAAAAAEYGFRKKWDRTTGAYRFSSEGTGATTGLVSTPILELPRLISIAKTEYLYVGVSDDYFAENFPALFQLPAPKNGDLYRISYAPDGTPSLTFETNIAGSLQNVRALERAH